jgi:hypothetical protein
MALFIGRCRYQFAQEIQSSRRLVPNVSCHEDLSWCDEQLLGGTYQIFHKELGVPVTGIDGHIPFPPHYVMLRHVRIRCARGVSNYDK